MNIVLRCLLVSAAALWLALCPLAAGSLSFDVLAETKRSAFNIDRSKSEHTNITKQKLGYVVTIQNRSFQKLDGLEVQYRQFKLDDNLRGDAKLIGVAGSTTIGTLANGQKFKFDTDPVEAESLELKPGWSYNDGARAKVHDALAGLWIRILQNGQVIFEWQTPTNLKTKAKWD